MKEKGSASLAIANGLIVFIYLLLMVTLSGYFEFFIVPLLKAYQ